jgi:hypothetical protein
MSCVFSNHPVNPRIVSLFSEMEAVYVPPDYEGSIVLISGEAKDF